MRAEQLRRVNNRLDALTFHLQGFTIIEIAMKFKVNEVTVRRWVRWAMMNGNMAAAANKRVSDKNKALENEAW